MGTTGHITLTDTVLRIAQRHAAVQGLTVDRWISLLIQAHDAPWPQDGMDDMGFPSPRLPAETTVSKSA